MTYTPATQAQGTKGTLRIAGLRAGVLTKWRVVISPTTKMYTLFGEGRIGRYYTQCVGMGAQLELTPAPTPKRVGRPTPKRVLPFVLSGRIAEIRGNHIVISHGEVERTLVPSARD